MPSQARLATKRSDPVVTAWLIGAAALTGARVILGLMPGMWVWGLNLTRFGGPLSWVLIGAPLLLLATSGLTWPERWPARIGDAWMRSNLAATIPCSLVFALVLLLPDRSHYVGDSLMRAGRLAVGIWEPGMFPQAMPLEPLVHLEIPVEIGRALDVSPVEVERWASALKAGALPLCGIGMARARGLPGPAAFALVVVAAFPGALAIFCGYSKAFVELCLLTAAFVAFGVRELEGKRGLVAASVTLALAFALHRAAILLAPAWLALAAVKWMKDRRRGMTDRFAWVASAVILVGACVWVGPHAFAAIRQFDRPHLVAGAGSLSEALALTFAPLRLLDLVNVCLLLCPVLPLLVLGHPGLDRRIEATSGWVLFVAASSVLGLLLVHPKAGLFRDWDVAASASVGLTYACAYALGLALARSKRSGVAALAIAGTAIGCTTSWMLVNASPERTLSRVEAYVSEPPPKAAQALGQSFRYLGLVYQDLNMDEQASSAFAQAASLVPSQSNWIAWAGHEVKRGRLREAQAIYRGLAARDDVYDSWLALARCSVALGDSAETVRAARRALIHRPDDPKARRLLAGAGR